MSEFYIPQRLNCAPDMATSVFVFFFKFFFLDLQDPKAYTQVI
jgi:hypothetical protein